MTKKPSSLKNQRIAHAHAIRFQKPTLAKQSSRDECDINLIMRKFEKNGLIEHTNNHPGGYGDYTDAPGFHEAQNIILKAQDMFMTVPSKIRASFNNDPAQFLQFVQDPKNIDELRTLGLTVPPPRIPNAPNVPDVTPPTTQDPKAPELDLEPLSK